MNSISACVSPFLWQFLVPLVSSACVVILVTIIAEKYGTKVGGILSTLPSTIVIALLIIALNKDADFAASAAAIVPAEMGINSLFLFTFVLTFNYGFIYALSISLGIWAFSSSCLYFSGINDIVSSIIIYIILMLGTFLVMEKIQKIKSKGAVKIRYTPRKILFRGMFAGIMITIAVLLANINEQLSGIFSVFPAVFLSTMIICAKEHNPYFTGALAKSMIYGTPTVVSYAISIYFLYPLIPLPWATIAAYALSLVTILFLLKAKKIIS